MKKSINRPRPLLLAPAGNRSSFIAALNAGADAIYCGLKNFSARMEAKNFNIEELAELSSLAKKLNVKLYIAINTILKTNEIKTAKKIIKNSIYHINPHAFIIQDLGFIPILSQIKFKGEIHLSTLANVTFSKALNFIYKNLKINHVIIPRELDIDEIKSMANECPPNFKLEIFIHGSLCFGISGRCYWSSYMGGKSSLRGYCLQPCRREYSSKHKKLVNVFSCKDLSLNILIKWLNNIPQIHTWKIEGRKKGPYYTSNTVSAYKMLRDHSKNPKTKETTQRLLHQSLGRSLTHYNFLTQEYQSPTKIKTQTKSGLLIGKIKNERKTFFVTNTTLFPGDILHIGSVDNHWHYIYKVNYYISKGNKIYLELKNDSISKNYISVFLKNRKVKNVNIKKIKYTKNNNLIKINKYFDYSKNNILNKKKITNLCVTRKISIKKPDQSNAIWLSKDLNIIKNTKKTNSWIWLPPTIWPKYEISICQLINKSLETKFKNFVLNSPWQMTFFKNHSNLNLWAGPFCNISNHLNLEVLHNIGFKGAIVSPELNHNDYLQLASNSPLPIGIVTSGNWPLCISRFIPNGLKLNTIIKSPKGENIWITKYNSNYWIFPDWELNIEEKREELIKSGYSMFITLREDIPKNIKLKQRSSLWNWKIKLK